MSDPKSTKPVRSFTDISLAFQPNPVSGDITVLKNERAINNSIKNLIMIIPGEVPFRWDVGSRASDYLFELVDVTTSGLLEQEIIRTIEYNEPRAEVIDAVVSPLLEYNEYSVSVRYKIVGYEEVFTYNQILRPTRS